MGSEKGTPNSIRSAPPRSSAATRPGVCAGEGSPAVKYAISAGRPSVRSRSNRRLILVWLIQFLQVFAIDIGIFVSAPRQVDDPQLTPGRRRAANRFRYGMGRFERRDDSFRPRQD